MPRQPMPPCRNAWLQPYRGTTMLEIKSVRMEVSADANIIAAGQVWFGIQRKLRSLLDPLRRK